jgi:stearoyl-CoA desaturase (delta-9 desaturase)
MAEKEQIGVSLPPFVIDWYRLPVLALMHVAALCSIFTGVTKEALIWFVCLHFPRMFGITGGMHGYFSHRSFKLGRLAQFVLAVLAQSTGQGGALTWAAYHRHHHRHTDTPLDVHSPKYRGFWYGHIGWLFDRNAIKNVDFSVRDFRVYPELDFLDRYGMLPSYVLAIVCALRGGSVFCFGFALSTVLVFHQTFIVNSCTHLWGSRRYETKDDSRNSWLIALIMAGEGWHNNHHFYPRSARRGFFWWEFDPTYYTIKVLGYLGIAKDIRVPPPHVLAAGSRRAKKPRGARLESSSGEADSATLTLTTGSAPSQRMHP